MFGIVISGTLAGGDPLKGYMVGFLGLFISTIGQDSEHAYPRFAFGNADLAGGIELLPALVGAFGLAEVLTAMGRPRIKRVVTKIGSVVPRPQDVAKYWRTILRSGLIGTFTGTLPGLGEETAAFAAYAAAKRASKEREKFGKGSVEGLIAAETGESACVPGAMIPVLTLAVPGSAPAAVLMAAMFIHGLNPGPMLLVTTPEYLYRVVSMLMIADMAKLFYGYFLVKPLLLILRVPHERLMPIVVVLCSVGAYATASRTFNIEVMLVFGMHRHAAAPLRLPHGADDPRHGARPAARQEPAARPDDLERQRPALLHAPDLHRNRAADARGHHLLRPRRVGALRGAVPPPGRYVTLRRVRNLSSRHASACMTSRRMATASQSSAKPR